MKPDAYLVRTDAGPAVQLDHAKAIDYAAQHHGTVHELVDASRARELLFALEAINVLINQPDPSRNIPLIRDACERALKS